MRNSVLVLVAALFVASCGTPKKETSSLTFPLDIHSHAEPQKVRSTHLELDLTVDFPAKKLSGSAEHTVAGDGEPGQRAIVFDAKQLKITKVEAAPAARNFRTVTHTLSAPDPIKGSALRVPLEAGDTFVRIQYETSPDAAALQWLEPAQTAGKTAPYLFTQGQPIYTRTWIPLQDTPSVRITYRAKIHTQPNFFAVMSASNDQRTMSPKGTYEFDMPQAIPPYLIALAVGELQFRMIGSRTGVYTEKAVLDAAGKEFVDLEDMLKAAEKLYGSYAWDRYDVLVCPPGFPIGGMENPRLTFATPTILAGDKSLVSLISHELAHSWSGNLVTNATWSDFWLNEGFTVYVERRIQEELYGRQRSEMEFAIEIEELKKEMASLKPEDTKLYIDLKGRDPEEGVTLVPYIKGALLLRAIEEEVGREAWDAFLRSYFAKFAFRSITTADFEAQLKEQFPNLKLDVKQWIYQAGLPANTPKIDSYLLQQVDRAMETWKAGGVIDTKEWVAQQWLHFLRGLPENLTAAQMAKLDASYRFTQTGNAEILDQWLVLSIRHGYAPAAEALEKFLATVGRQKFLKPLYTELAKTPAGKAKAQSLYAKYKANYHPIAANAISALLAK
ncbi:MAG: M1 family metallopeptidase [Bryobacter sp.]|nr:M1 family metallopeptidase [Bryobacter sp.]